MLIFLAIGPLQVRGQLPRIRLDSVFPPGGQANTDLVVQISGELTDAATELVFSDPGIVATQQIDGPGEYTVAHRRARRFDVHIEGHVPDGRYDVRALGPAGLSGPRTFIVSRLKQKQFDAAENSPQRPFDVAIGEVVNAKCRADQRDYYAFVGKQGQPTLIQVWADRIDSKMDALCAVYDGASGKRLMRVSQGSTRDPVITFVPPEDGEYLVEVWEATYRGGDDYAYRLEVSNRAQVEAIHPVVAVPGQEAEFTVYGFNLPGGTTVSGSSALGNLQSLSLAFRPEFQFGVCVDGPSRARACSAGIEGGAVALPVPLSTSHVFLTTARQAVIREAPENDTVEQAHVVDMPCEIAGQFYPRRDVDWYQFQARKGQVVWLEVSAQQLGTSADPVLRVGKLERTDDGRIKLQDVATADDLEGAPSSRDSRRLYSGTRDAAYRFRAAEDGTYVVSVSDQFNSAADDPRLVYRLSVVPEQPDFQLLAFADPERHGDAKIVKPNGVSMIPGGSSAVRVRLLPSQGFSAPVHVSASGLPAGVIAHPLILSARQREGLLVLTATDDAMPGYANVVIRGETRVGGKAWSRQASIGTIVRGVNNADSDATEARRADDLVVTVVDSKPLPLHFPSLPPMATSVGGRITVPVQLARAEELSGQELQIEAGPLPSGIKLASAKTKDNTVEMVVSLEDAKLPPGQYTLGVAAKVKQKRPKNLVLAKEAAADLEKVAKLAETRSAQWQSATAALAESRKAAAAASRAYEEQLAETREPREQLTSVLETQKQAAIALADSLQAALADVASRQHRQAVAAAESKIQRVRQQRVQLESTLSSALESLPELSQTANEKAKAQAQAEQALESLAAKRDEAVQKKQEAEKRLTDVNKAQLEQDAEFWVYSPTFVLDVRSTPVTMYLTKAAIHPGETVSIPVSIHREFGFQGQVAMTVSFGKESGLVAAPLVVGAGQSLAKLEVTAANGARLGDQTLVLKTKLRFNKLDITDSVTSVIEVVPKEQ